ncbi:hypothetical protein K501DRAFT_276884 [Backusella circina FSU 941]|nr:hypothetical protein K501DRAFT_276884 [Backusella circina FSU 941]
MSPSKRVKSTPNGCEAGNGRKVSTFFDVGLEVRLGFCFAILSLLGHTRRTEICNGYGRRLGSRKNGRRASSPSLFRQRVNCFEQCYAKGCSLRFETVSGTCPWSYVFAVNGFGLRRWTAWRWNERSYYRTGHYGSSVHVTGQHSMPISPIVSGNYRVMSRVSMQGKILVVYRTLEDLEHV